MIMSDERDRVIELILEQTGKLLRESWAEVQAFRQDDTKIKLTLTHAIHRESSLRQVKTALSFGRRFKQITEKSFDLAQLELLPK
jgi:hypothetical protein